MMEEAEQKGAEKLEAAANEAEQIIRELRSIKQEHRSFKEHELIDAKNVSETRCRLLKNQSDRKERQRKNAS